MVQMFGFLPQVKAPDLPDVGNALNKLGESVRYYRSESDKAQAYADAQEQKRYSRGRASAGDGKAEVEAFGKRALQVAQMPDDDPMKPKLWGYILDSHNKRNPGAQLSAEEMDWKTGPKLMAAQAGQFLDPYEQEERKLKLEKLRRDAAGPVSNPLDDELKRVQIEKLRSEAQNPKPQFTPAETAVDRAFAKTYEEDFASGNFADQQKNVDQLRGVQRELEAGKKNLTGPVLGRLPDAVTSFVNPEAVDTRERVEEVVQRNLRVILGAQFTNEEGKRLIARAYNPALPEEVNAQRLNNLITAMDRAMKAKQAAAQYYEQNGTLRGYRGPAQFTASDLEAAIDAVSSGNQAPAGGGFKYLGPAQ